MRPSGGMGQASGESTMRRALVSALTVLALFSATGAQATDLVMYETDVDLNSLNEIYLTNYLDHADFLAGDLPNSEQYIPVNVAPSFSIADFAYDGSYRVLFETDTDVNSLNELYMLNFSSEEDFLAGQSNATSQYVGLNVAEGYSVAGFTYDGIYRLLFETDTDVNGVTELYLANYASLSDLLIGNNAAGSGYLAWNVGDTYSVSGLAFDGTYHLLFETDADINGVTEVYAAHYATLTDLFAGTTIPPTQFVTLNVAPSFSILGYEMITNSEAVPEPSTWAMMLIGFGSVGFVMRRRRQTKMTFRISV